MGHKLVRYAAQKQAFKASGAARAGYQQVGLAFHAVIKQGFDDIAIENMSGKLLAAGRPLLTQLFQFFLPHGLLVLVKGGYFQREFFRNGIVCNGFHHGNNFNGGSSGFLGI